MASDRERAELLREAERQNVLAAYEKEITRLRGELDKATRRAALAAPSPEPGPRTYGDAHDLLGIKCKHRGWTQRTDGAWVCDLCGEVR